jgi:hypothetical protein
MILLYIDHFDKTNNIQEIIRNMKNDDNIICFIQNRINTCEKFKRPVNITDNDIETFIKLSFSYIKNIRDKFTNNLVLDEKPLALKRQTSIECSKISTHSVFNFPVNFA